MRKRARDPERTQIRFDKETLRLDAKIQLAVFEEILGKLEKIYLKHNIFEKIPTAGVGYVVSDLHGDVLALEAILSSTSFFETAKKLRLSSSATTSTRDVIIC
jgi:hypothetical protein